MSYKRPKARLVSGMYGNGGASGIRRKNTGDRVHGSRNRARPYRVIGTTAGAYTTGVSHNTTRIFRDER